jgi:hypothetical protein
MEATHKKVRYREGNGDDKGLALKEHVRTEYVMSQKDVPS